MNNVDIVFFIYTQFPGHKNKPFFDGYYLDENIMLNGNEMSLQTAS